MFQGKKIFLLTPRKFGFIISEYKFLINSMDSPTNPVQPKSTHQFTTTAHSPSPPKRKHCSLLAELVKNLPLVFTLAIAY
jgi:hypothetical protein